MPVLAHCDMETEGELVMLFYARAYTDYGKQFSCVNFSVNSFPQITATRDWSGKSP